MIGRKLFLSSVICLSLIFICSAGVLGSLALEMGEKPTVTLVAGGNGAGFTINRDSGNLFDNFTNVMPGDTLTQEVVVQSASGNSGQFRIYLYAVQGEETSAGFLNGLTLKVTDAGRELNVMKNGGENTGTLGVLLGTFNPGDKKTLTVSLSLPIEAGDDFQGAKSFVNWHFYAEQAVEAIPFEYLPGQNVSPLPSDNPDPEVPDEDTPEADFPEETGTEPVPRDGVPKTGDNSHLLFWISLMTASGSALVCLLVFGNKGTGKASVRQKDKKREIHN